MSDSIQSRNRKLSDEAVNETLALPCSAIDVVELLRKSHTVSSFRLRE